MKAKPAEDGSFMRIDVMSMLKLLLVSGVAITFLALFVLIGFGGSPPVAKSDWTSNPTRCKTDFSISLYKACLGPNSTTTIQDPDTNGTISAIDEVLSLPSTQQKTVLSCMFDACTNRTNRPFSSYAQTLHSVHYSFGLNGLSQFNRYFYIEASFPNLQKKARSFDVTMTPHVKGFYLNESSGNITSTSVITNVVQKTVLIDCEEGNAYCEPAYFLRFGDIDFNDYQVDVLFNSTESLAVIGSNVQFRKTWGTESFTKWLIGVKFFFLFESAFITAWYIFSVNKLSSREQNVEQGFVMALALSLILFNDPFYFTEAKYGSNAARILSVGFQVTFFQMLLLFWLVSIDNLRLQGKENGVSNVKFFGPKLLFVAFFWWMMVIYYGYIKYYRNNDVTWDPLAENSTFASLKTLCGLLSAVFIVWYGILIAMSFREIRTRRMRYRYLVVLSVLMVIASFAGFASGEFSPTPTSGGAWTSLQTIFNIYVYTLCYLYAPSISTLNSLRKSKRTNGEDPESKAVLKTSDKVVEPDQVELAGVDEIRDTDLA
ncbi:Transmembrane protein 181 [Phytophthora citrophthora]|uniref:Transmembrane protein 181 n=1 Tax=Phytophthora citrophthora TaxID=4793 RepID=A0AAD9GLA1_9STRA|nr:Transmembrane protein 181 [Phytophthora citrophthora]